MTGSIIVLLLCLVAFSFWGNAVLSLCDIENVIKKIFCSVHYHCR